MTKIGLIALAVTTLAAACGDAVNAGKDAWIKQCVAGGDDRNTCVCVISNLQENLEPDAFRAMVLDARGKLDQASRIRKGMPMDRRMAAMNVAMKAANTCGAKTVRLRAPSLNRLPPPASLPDNK